MGILNELEKIALADALTCKFTNPIRSEKEKLSVL
jgi:hypothetical protein